MESRVEASGPAVRTKRTAWIWIAPLLLVLAAAGLYFGVQSYRYRLVRVDADLLRFLPDGDLTRFYVNAEALRRGGYLHLLNESKSKQAPEYLQFVHETGFDYARDIDAAAGAADGKQWWFTLRGRFDWAKLAAYAKEHGGRCSHQVCSVPGSEPGRWVSYRSVQPDALALAVSTDSDAADRMSRTEAEPLTPSDAPVWVTPSHKLLTNPSDLPLALRLFAISLESADSVVLSLRQAERTSDAFAIELNAAFSNEPAADTARQQLENDTNLARAELAREHQRANPADLTGLLTAGTFHAGRQHMTGNWPVSWALLKSLQ